MSLKGEVRKEEFFKHVEDCQDNNKFYRLSENAINMKVSKGIADSINPD